MENDPPNLLKFVSFPRPKLPHNKIVNKDGSTTYVQYAELIRLLSEGLRAQYEVLTPPNDGAGIRQPDGNWSGLLGMIIRSEADLAIGVLLTEERYQAVNFTFPHSLSRITFMTDRPQPVSKNLVLFHPFSYEVWITLSLLLAAVAFLFYLLMNRKTPLQRVVLMTAGSLLQQPIDFKMETNALMLLTSTWFLGVMILSYSYKAVLLSFLSFPTLSGIRDISDLSAASTDASFKCFANKGSYLFGYFLESQDDGLKAIGDCLNRNKLGTRDDFKRASRKAFVGGLTAMPSWGDDYFVSEDSFTIAMGGILFSRTFCCPNRLNSIVLRLVASGLFDKIRGDDVFLVQLKRKFLRSDASETAAKIHLYDTSGAFYILMSGWLLSFVVFLAEIWIAKYRAN